MPVKDHYSILEVSPGATLQQIKKAYRRLAMQFHPDKNNGNRYTDAYYDEIKTAYETLADPVKREQYHQQRWLAKSMGRTLERTAPLTPPVILLQAQKLRTYTENIDVFRMDEAALHREIDGLLKDEYLDCLNTFNDSAINDQVFANVLRSMQPLRYNAISKLDEKLQRIGSAGNKQQLAQLLRQKKREQFIEKYQAWFILALTALICFLIYMIAG